MSELSRFLKVYRAKSIVPIAFEISMYSYVLIRCITLSHVFLSELNNIRENWRKSCSIWDKRAIPVENEGLLFAYNTLSTVPWKHVNLGNRLHVHIWMYVWDIKSCNLVLVIVALSSEYEKVPLDAPKCKVPKITTRLGKALVSTNRVYASPEYEKILLLRCVHHFKSRNDTGPSIRESERPSLAYYTYIANAPWKPLAIW